MRIFNKEVKDFTLIRIIMILIFIVLLIYVISKDLKAQERYIVPCDKVLITNFLNVARSQMGLNEGKGNRGANVDKYNKSVGNPLGSPYCAAFVYWSFDSATNSNKQLIPIKKTGLANGIYNAAKSKGKKQNNYLGFKSGDLFVVKYPQNSSGHIAIISKDLGNGNIETYEANTSGSASGNQRDGEGNRIKKRNVRHPIGRMQARGIVSFQ